MNLLLNMIIVIIIINKCYQYKSCTQNVMSVKSTRIKINLKYQTYNN